MSSNRLPILEAVNQCSYNANIKDYITNIIFVLCSQSKPSRYYKCNRVIGDKTETIIVIRFIINTKFMNNFYEIPILIYIPSAFPYAAPEIYIERTSKNIGVNENNRDIDPKTNRIKTKELLNWNSYSTLQNVITEINASFNSVFPIFQITNPNYQVGNNTTTNTSNTNLSNPKSVFNYEEQNQINQNLNQFYQQYQNQQQMQMQSGQNFFPQNQRIPNQMNNQFNNLYVNDNQAQYEATMKSILIEEIKKLIYKPVCEEIRKLSIEREKLTNYKSVFLNLVKRYNDYLMRRDEIIPYMHSLIKHLDSEYISIRTNYINAKNNSISKENCFSLVKINNQNLIQSIAMEATIEDCLNLLKKAFERNIINFTESIKYMRIFSREMMKIKTIREKLLTNN
jgi:hypothetical protein